MRSFVLALCCVGLAAPPVSAAPPHHHKDLDFPDGWSFRAREPICVATRAITPDIEIDIAFTSVGGSSINIAGKTLPAIVHDEDGEDDEDEDAPGPNDAHYEGSHEVRGADGGYIPRLDPGIDYDNFPGTALFVDGDIAARFSFGQSREDKTVYHLNGFKGEQWPIIEGGKEMRLKLLGAEAGVIPIGAAHGLWREMRNCIAGYPGG